MRNPTLLQCFHWYYPAGGELWPEVAALAPNLHEIGINMIWLPPASKGASGGYSVGYDSYDLFDLGEFEQKGSVATKYGDKAQLLQAIDALQQHNIAVLMDVVLNHKMGRMRRSIFAYSVLTPTIEPRLMKRSSSARHGPAIHSPRAKESTRSLSGISNALAASTISRILTRTAFSKSLTTIPVKAGMTRSMTKWATLII